MSLGNILAAAAPIAAGYFTGGASFGAMGAGAGIAAGAATGMGIAALQGNNVLMGGVMGGLGGYGGVGLADAFNPALAQGIASSTGATTAAANQAAMSNLTGNALGQGGMSTVAGRGLMGVATPGMAGAASAGAGAGANTGLQNVTAGNTGQGFSPFATPDTLGQSVTQASGIPQAIGPNTTVGLNQAPGTLSPFQRGATTNIGLSGAGNTSPMAIQTPDYVNSALTSDPSKQMLQRGVDTSVRNVDGSFAQIAQRPDFSPIAGSNVAEGALPGGYVDTSFSAGLERLGDGSMGKGAMKAGLLALGPIAAGFEPEYETFDEVREDKYDPNDTLNLNDPALDSGIEDVINADSGLRLYAKEGGMIPAYESGGIINQAPMNVNTAGANVTGGGMNVNNVGANMGLNSVANLNQGASNMQGLGGLNVNTGATSVSDYEQSILDKPLYKDIGFTGIGGYGGPSRVPYDYSPGNRISGGANYTTNRDGTFTRVGPVPEDALEVQQQKIRDRIAGSGPMNLNDKGLNVNSSMNINDLPSTKFYATGGMLEGPGDGMSDSLAAKIDGKQPAALSQGEFVLPADIVSDLGNGSSDAGSKRLYAMMDEIRLAKTGRKKQPPEIDPERFMLA